MNLKQAKRLRLGALVRSSWNPKSSSRRGIVLAKQHIIGQHAAKSLCQIKDERYEVTVHWYQNYGSEAICETCQNWEIMLISNPEP